MPSIKEFFADAKLTPVDRGTAAFEQAGRRVAMFTEQNAQGEKELGRDIAKLWEQAKFALDVKRAEAEPGRGGGIRGGNVHDVLDFGRPFGADNGANGREGNPNLPNEYSGGFNARAARDIGSAAASLPTLVIRLAQGQGLTDQQYQELGLSPSGAAKLFSAQHQGYVTGLYDKDKGAILPNPEPSGSEVDVINTEGASTPVAGKTVNYGQQVPDYPWSSSQFGPPIEGRDKNGVGTGSNVPGGSPLDPNSQNYVGNYVPPTDISQTQGAQNWSAIQSEAGTGYVLPYNTSIGSSPDTPTPNPTSSSNSDEFTGGSQ